MATRSTMQEALHQAGYRPVYSEPVRLRWTPPRHKSAYWREEELLLDCQAKLRDCTTWDDIVRALD